MDPGNWKVGDIVCLYITTSPSLCRRPSVGLITGFKQPHHWEVLYETEWGTRTIDVPPFMLYPAEVEKNGINS